MRVKLISIYVDDQDAALDFYVNKLGMKLHTDAAYGPGTRWLTVTAPGDDKLELVLSIPDPSARSYRDGLVAIGKPYLSLETEDIQAEYEKLVARGVEFSGPPEKREYGGTDAVFEDGCGNLLNLHQADD